MVSPGKEHHGAEKGFPYIYLSQMQAEDPDPEGKRQDPHLLPEMRNRVYQKKLRDARASLFSYIFLRKDCNYSGFLIKSKRHLKSEQEDIYEV